MLQLKKKETSLSERESIVDAEYDGTRDSFEHTLEVAARDYRLVYFTNLHIKKFKCYSHLFPLLFSEERSSKTEDIVIAFGNISLIKLTNTNSIKSGEMTYVDLECMQNIIQSLEFNPLNVACPRDKGSTPCDSEICTPLTPYSPAEKKYNLLPSCCTPTSEALPEPLSPNTPPEMDTGIYMPTKQSLVLYVLEVPTNASAAVSLIIATVIKHTASAGRKLRSNKSTFTSLILLLTMLTTLTLIVFKYKEEGMGLKK